MSLIDLGDTRIKDNLIDLGYELGSLPAEETSQSVTADKRVLVLNGVPADAEYTVEVRAYRSVDRDIHPAGLIESAPGELPANPFRPSTKVVLGKDAEVGGKRIVDVVSAVDVAKKDIADLVLTYGSTDSAATNAAAANAAKLVAEALRDQAKVSADAADAAKINAQGQAAIAAAKAAEADGSRAIAEAKAAAADAAKTAAETAKSGAETARTTAQTAADAAAQAKVDSEGARNAAQSAQTAANTSANNAATSATNAGNSATTASGHATTASQKADAAGASATTASGQASIATTKAGEASTSASNAATSATNAAGSASSATTQAGVAATSATGARLAGAALLPDNFERKGLFFQGNSAGQPGTIGQVADSAFVTVSGIGNVWQITNFSIIAPTGVIKPVAGRTYEVEARVRILSDNTAGGNSNTTLQFVGLRSDYTEETYISTPVSGFPTSQNNRVTDTDFVTWKCRYSSASPSAYLRPRFYSNWNGGSGASGNQTVQLAYLKVTDITETLASAASASAASTSASTAATKASEAGTSASAANTSATNAATSAGNASTSATNAATSATNASGSANTATTQAGVAATQAGAARDIVTNGPILPFSPASGLDQFSNGRIGSPASMGTIAATVVVDDLLGTSAHITNWVSAGANMVTRGVIELVPGRIYELRTRARVMASDGSVGFNHIIIPMGADYATTSQGIQFVNAVTTVDDSVVEIVSTFGTSGARFTLSAGTVYVRCGFRLNTTESGLVVRVGEVRVTDVTDRVAALNSANAAATSASTASTEAGKAGTSATAANTSATNAATSAGNASTSASNASTSATNAQGSANTASTQAGVASTAKNDAQTAAGTATTKAGEAAGSATAAANSASTASTKAGEAGTSATAANTAKTAAETARGQAETFRNDASTSASNAAGSANTATTQAGVASSASTSAINSARNMLPVQVTAENFTIADRTAPNVYWENNYLAGTVDGSNYVVCSSLGRLPVQAGRTYEVASEMQAWDYANSENMRGGSGFVIVRQDGSIAGNDAVATFASPANGNYVLRTNTYTALANDAFLIPRVVIYATSRFRLRTIKIADVTEREAAKGSATAAATSASTASTKASEAGSSATAANTSATNAATSAGNASTSANNASTSATNAAGSANTATTQAGVASTARNDAQTAAGTATTKAGEAAGSATSAANSASTATTKAIEAGTSASAANTAKTAAETAKGQAESYRNDASTSASNAAGSANTATVQAGVAAQSRDKAVAAAGGNLVTKSTFSDGTIGQWIGAVSAFTDGADKVLRCVDRDNYDGAAFAPMTGVRRLRVTVRGKAPGNAPLSAGVNVINAAGSLNWIGARIANAGTTTYATVTADIVTPADTVGYRPWVQSDAQGGSGGQDVRVASIVIEDVTDSYAAQQSASAAAGSASTATTKASEAGTSASAANTAKTAAETARGQAETYRNEASTSASNAQGSANTAATQAGVAASNKTAAEKARGDAASYASRNLVRKGVYNDGDAGSWQQSGATVININTLPQQLSGHSVALYIRTIVDYYEVGNDIESNWGNRKIQITGKVMVGGDAGFGVGVLQHGIGLNWLQPATTMHEWRSFSHIITLNENTKAITPFVRINSNSWAALTELRWEDVTESQKSLDSANASAGSASTATTKANEAGASASAANTAKTAAETAKGLAETYRNDASTSASNASGSANTATTQAGVASTAKTDAQTAKTAAETARGQAQSSASAAAGSASTASTKANEASTSAASASTAKTAAETAKGQAETYRNEASTSATNAVGSANTATTQAGVAATARDAATAARDISVVEAAKAFPGFETRFDYWGFDTQSGGRNAGGGWETQRGGGALSFPSAGNWIYMDPKGWIKSVKGKRYKAGFWILQWGAAGGYGGKPRLYWEGHNSNHSNGDYFGAHADAPEATRQFYTAIPDGNWHCYATEFEMTDAVVANPNGYWFRPRINIDSIPANAGYVIAGWFFEDITDSTSAKGFANAASTSASTASAKADAAGSSASAANTAKTNAETARGQAEVYRNEAASSRDTAGSHASTASSQAGLAATYRDQALGARDTANTHASTAQSQAAIATGAAATATTQAQITARASGGGGNLLINSEFDYGSMDDWANFGSFVAGANNAPNADYVPVRGNNYMMRSTSPADNTFGLYNITMPAIKGGSFIEASAYVVAHRTQVWMQIEWWNATTQIGSSSPGWQSVAGGGAKLLNDYTRIVHRAQAPAGASFARLLIQFRGYQAGNDCYGWVHKPMLCEVINLIGDPVPYSPATIGRVTQQAGAIAAIDGRTKAYLQNSVVAGTSTARLSLYAESSPGVRASAAELVADAVYLGNNRVLEVTNGLVRVNGKVSAANVEASSLSAISANIGLLKSAESGRRTEIDNGGVRAYHPNGNLAVRMGTWD